MNDEISFENSLRQSLSPTKHVDGLNVPQMPLYVVIMYCLSLFGFFIIFFSFSLLIFVPTKLNNFTRFVIHGHDFTSAITQLYLTLGATPTFVFPCAAGYVNGFMSNYGMRPLDQLGIEVTLITISKSFTLLLTINRVFAINAWMKRHENLILIIFFAQLIGQVVFLLITGFNMKDGGEEAQQTCLEIITYEYPKVMYTSRGFNMSLQDENSLFTSLIIGLASALYLITEIVCVSILIQSIREQAKSSQSTQFLANQRRITSGILYFMILEFFGLLCPTMIISGCIIFKVGNTAISYCSYIAQCIYPIFGPYYVLMSNRDYRNKVKGILRKDQADTKHLSAQEVGSRTLSI